MVALGIIESEFPLAFNVKLICLPASKYVQIFAANNGYLPLTICG